MSNPLKVIFGHPHSRVWSIVTIATIAILTPASIIARSNILSGVLDMAFGGDRAVTAEGGTTVDSFKLSDNVKAGDKESSMANTTSVASQINDEGMVLLKNTGILPYRTSDVTPKISVFGKNSLDIAISGSGSAGNAASGIVKTIYDSLKDAGYEVNPTLKSFYEKDGTARSSNPGMDDGGASTLDIGETPVSSYTSSVKESFSGYRDMAVVVLTRIGGEGFDLPRQQPNDSSKTFLDLYPEEREMIKLVEDSGFNKIVVVINAANQLCCTELESDSKIGAILWAGFPGAQGIMSVGRILNGTVNPSGHLVDTYVKDFKYIPSYYNFGNNGVTDGDRFINNGKNKTYYFVDYEEGIYVGYRYFETGAAMKGEDWYNNRVLYPFGYGLSYSNFSWNVKNADKLKDAKITTQPFNVEIEVTNESDVAGKDVVEIYMTPNYIEGGIEKSTKVLVGFAKTDMIEAHGKATVNVTVDPYSFASYDNEDKNGDGFRGYELDAGTYVLSVGKTAHDSSTQFNMGVDTVIKYENDPVTGTKVENHFDDADEHLQEEDLISRASGKTWDDFSSLTPTTDDRTISNEFLSKLTDKDWIDPANPIVAQENVAMPTNDKYASEEEAASRMKLVELAGKDFNDSKWEDLLDQASLGEEIDMFRDAGFHTLGMESITKPKTTDADGPVGFTLFMGDPTIYDTVTFNCEVTTASTWNVELSEKLGEAVGDEGLIGNVKGDGLPYTGWYAPAMNLHRNPFGGRCCEYYSEDPFLSGKMGAAEVKGARSKGLITYLKHFVGNEGETNRDTNGDCTFVSEQALRELYLKPFEITVKEGGALGVMTSFNRIGTYWTGANYSLCTTVLRNEWGFHGAVITDFNTHHTKAGYMHLKPMLYAGCNLDLCSQALEETEFFDRTSAKEVTLLRNSTKEVLYAVVNSNAMGNEIDHYEPAYWKIILTVVDIAVPAGLAIWGVFAIMGAYRKEREGK